LKPEWWGSPLAQEQKYQGRKKTCDMMMIMIMMMMMNKRKSKQLGKVLKI
jgi:hypothetical protein